jgi:hypothetical protein
MLLISASICLAEEPVAERPIYTKGDFWVFVNRNQFKKMKQTFLREEKNKYVFRLGKGDRTSHYYFTSDVTRGIGYPGPIIDFPLKVGKKWKYRYQRTVSSPGATGDTILAQHKVESYEPVTVPAGTFQALKISVIIESSETIVTIPEKMYFWYAPEVKQIIKRIMMGKTWELKKYKIK